MPELSSANVTAPARTLKLGKYRIPIGKPAIAAGRKSESFWSILGKFGIFSAVLRVPITFPPEKFNARMLSAMCTPDLLGTQGTFALYTTRHATGEMESGNRYPLAEKDGKWIPGVRPEMHDWNAPDPPCTDAPSTWPLPAIARSICTLPT